MISSEHISSGNYMFVKHCKWNSWWQQAFQQINLQILPSQCHRTTQEEIDCEVYFAALSRSCYSVLTNTHLALSSDCIICSSQLDVP